MTSLLMSNELKNNLILNGNKQVKKYSWERCAHETLEIYKKVLAN